MSRRDWTLFVADMHEACDKIAAYTSGMDFDEFCADTRTVDAFVRNLEIIGEASKGIPDDQKLLGPEIDWRAIKGLRNRIVHEYFGLSLEVVGNSRGLRLAKPLLEQAGLSDEVDIQVAPGILTIRPVARLRAGWEEAAAAAPPEAERSAPAGTAGRAAAVSRSLFRGATLLDTGPLVAWSDRSDKDYAACTGFFQRHQGAFVSTWPVVSEVCHLIPADVAPRFLAWVSLGGSALEWMATWMRQYGDLPGGESLENLLNP